MFAPRSMISRWWIALSLLCAVACGGPHFDGRVYRDGELSFRVGPIPAAWRHLDASHALIAFRDDASSATVAVSGRCGKDGDDVPLQALTHHLFLHFTEREVVEQRTVALDGRDALRTEMRTRLDGVPKHFTVYVLKKDGCVYDFLHITSRGAAGQADFDRFVAGFTTTG